MAWRPATRWIRRGRRVARWWKNAQIAPHGNSDLVPTVAIQVIFRSNAERPAVADGRWRLRRLLGEPVRLVGIAFEYWSRYASDPLGQRAQVAVFAPAPDKTGR